MECSRKEALWNLLPVKHSLNQSNILMRLLNNEKGGQRSVVVNVLGVERKRLKQCKIIFWIFQRIILSALFHKIGIKPNCISFPLKENKTFGNTKQQWKQHWLLWRQLKKSVQYGKMKSYFKSVTLKKSVQVTKKVSILLRFEQNLIWYQTQVEGVPPEPEPPEFFQLW